MNAEKIHYAMDGARKDYMAYLQRPLTGTPLPNLDLRWTFVALFQGFKYKALKR